MIRSTVSKIVMILSFLFLLFSSYVFLFDNHAFLFGYKIMYVESNSMLPIFSKDELILIKKVDYNLLREQDIITYNYNGNYITHRIIEIEYDSFQTKGDNNNYIDIYKITSKDILGKYVYKIIHFGLFLNICTILMIIFLIRQIPLLKTRK